MKHGHGCMEMQSTRDAILPSEYQGSGTSRKLRAGFSLNVLNHRIAPPCQKIRYHNFSRIPATLSLLPWMGLGPSQVPPMCTLPPLLGHCQREESPPYANNSDSTSGTKEENHQLGHSLLIS